MFNQFLQQVEVSDVPGLVPAPACGDSDGAAEVLAQGFDV
jgi:hypothetical protein